MGWGVFAGALATTGMKTYRDLKLEDREEAKVQLAQNADARAAGAEGRAQGTYDREVRSENEKRAAYAFKPGQAAAINNGGSGAALEAASAPAVKGLPTPTAQPGAAVPAAAKAAIPTPAKAAPTMSALELARARDKAQGTEFSHALLQEAEREARAQQELQIRKRDSDTLNRMRNDQMSRDTYDHARKQYTDKMKGVGGVLSQLDKVGDPKTSIKDPSIQSQVQDILTGVTDASRFTNDGKDYGFDETPDGYKLYAVNTKTGKRIEGSERLYTTVQDLREAYVAAAALGNEGTFEQYGLASKMQELIKKTPELREKNAELQSMLKDRANLADPERKQRMLDIAHEMANIDPDAFTETVKVPQTDSSGDVVKDDNGKTQMVEVKQNKLIRQIEAAAPRMSMLRVGEKGVTKAVTAQQVVLDSISDIPDLMPKFQYDPAKVFNHMVNLYTEDGWNPDVASWMAKSALTKAELMVAQNNEDAADKLRSSAIPMSVKDWVTKTPYQGVATDNVQ